MVATRPAQITTLQRTLRSPRPSRSSSEWLYYYLGLVGDAAAATAKNAEFGTMWVVEFYGSGCLLQGMAHFKLGVVG